MGSLSRLRCRDLDLHCGDWGRLRGMELHSTLCIKERNEPYLNICRVANICTAHSAATAE